jgi:DNA-binding GntR family transcriptional regulator
MRPVAQEPALTVRVRDAIVSAIVDGTLRTGDRLAQEDLAARLGVSRQPVSHALNLLKEQGILVELGRKGLTVAPMDPDRLVQLYQVRGALDALAARLAAERVGQSAVPKSALDPLDALIAQQSDPARAGDFVQRVEADVTFHVTLYELSGNPAIEEVARPHWVHFRRSMQAVLVDPGIYPPVWQQHRAIFRAVAAADAEAAERLAREHAQTAATKTAARLRTGDGIGKDHTP